MNDNITAHDSAEYDSKILTTIPFYNLFHESTLDLIESLHINIEKWLDTGCGTGNLTVDAIKLFSNVSFVLADPSNKMLEIAKEKIKVSKNITFVNASSQRLDYEDNTFDVITAIQSHHYLSKPDRVQATKNCFRMLKPNGVFITFENIMPLSGNGVNIALSRWKNYQISCGKTYTEAKKHIDRFNKEYFPISIIEHIDLMNETGFNNAEILWASYMQAGFYAIK